LAFAVLSPDTESAILEDHEGVVPPTSDGRNLQVYKRLGDTSKKKLGKEKGIRKGGRCMGGEGEGIGKN
jgi:hypothetical protein